MIPDLENGLQVPPRTVVTSSGILVHAIQTGYVAVKLSHCAYAGPDALALPTILLDWRWTEWLPIYCWAIEHPEGIIVIDTGESSQSADPEYFACDPGSRFVYNRILRFAVTKEDEIGMQLRQLGIPPEEVRWVVQTHLHSDHADGMDYFPNSEFLIGAADYPNSQGALPCHNPDWLDPTLVTFTDGPLLTFERSHALTKDDTVSIVPTSGHSGAHQSVVLQDNNQIYFFAGDASFDTQQIEQSVVAGICSHRSAARATSERIRQLLDEHPTVYLPSHDPGSAERLVSGTVATIS